MKVHVLDLLKSSADGTGIRDVPVDLLKEIARERNNLAHGHFDQNPSGEYDVVSKNVRRQYSAEQLNALTAKASEVWMALRHAEAFYQFSDPSE